MKKLLYTIMLLTTFSCRSSGQKVESDVIQNFMTNHLPKEENFISLIKQNKIDSCMAFFSKEVKNQIGIDSLRKELNKLHQYLLQDPNPKIEYAIGQSINGVGAFGHDIQGNFELKASYQLLDNNQNVIYFALYYTNLGDEGEIKKYDCIETKRDFQQLMDSLNNVDSNKKKKK